MKARHLEELKVSSKGTFDPLQLRPSHPSSCRMQMLETSHRSNHSKITMRL